MRHPVAALAWEIWQAHRRGFLCLVTAIPVCALLYRLPAFRESALLHGLSFLPMVGSLLFLFAAFKYTETDRRNRQSGFPSRLFTLPLRTGCLVTCPMAFAAAIITLTYLCWAQLVFAPLGKVLPLVWPSLYLATSMLCFQAVVWTMARFRVTRLVALGVLGTAIATGWLLFRDDLGGAMAALLPWDWARGWLPHLLLGALGLLSATAYFTALVAVGNQRCGGVGHGGLLSKRLEAMLDAQPRQRAPFPSPAWAQFWLEWRRQGFLLPVMVAAVLALIVILGAWIGPLDPGQTMLALMWILVTPIALATAIGKGFGKFDLWSHDLAIPPFFAVQPVSAEKWITTKLKAAAASSSVAWLLVLLSLPMWLGYAADFEVLIGWQQRLERMCSPTPVAALLALLVPVGVLLTWRMLISGICSGVWGRRGLFTSSICIPFVVVFVALQVVLWLQNAPTQLPRFAGWVIWLPWVLSAFFMTKVWLAVWSWRAVLERGLCSSRTACGYFIAWLSGTAILVLFVCLLCPAVDWIRRLLILSVVLALPVARVGVSMLAFNQNRIR